MSPRATAPTGRPGEKVVAVAAAKLPAIAAHEQVPARVTERLRQLETLVAALQAENQRLHNEIAELRRRLGQTSQTSHRPPSSDGPRKPPRPAVPRQPGARRPGKQPGSPGAALAQVTDPDERRIHVPTSCRACGAALLLSPVVGVARRQVHELPEVRLRVVEHVAEQRRCACGQTTTASFPDGVTAPACYGPGVRALGCYLLAAQHLSVERAAALLSEVLGAPVATGTLAGLLGQAHTRLAGFAEQVRGLLRAAPVVHLDETSARVAGRGHWVHSASTQTLTWQIAHPKRGREGIDAAGVLPGFTGVAVHDDWAPYRTYPTATHALCGAHLLRELAEVAQASGQQWAKRMRAVLLDAREVTEQARAAGASCLDTGVGAGLHVRYQQAIAEGLHANPAAGLPAGQRRRIKRPAAVNLLARLIAHQDEVLRFVEDLRVPFTNNRAENDIRMVKLQQKISGSWRTLPGAQAFLAVRSYLSTARKHGLNALAVLRQLFNGAPWLPNQPPSE
jgi:transposase